MRKVLMYATVASAIQQFNMENIRILQKLGYKVEVACNFEFGNNISKEDIVAFKKELMSLGVSFYQIPIPRNIKALSNIRYSYQLTKQLLDHKEYDLIHCHTPIAAIICRIANKKAKNYNNTMMIYTAHGFHFFKGNTLIKNFIFKNVEKVGARFTDILITINKEDYEAAKQFKLKRNGQVEYIPGVGIDTKRFELMNFDRNEYRKKLGYQDEDFVILSVGELNKNKNHEVILRAIAKLNNPHIKFMVAGIGALHDYLLNLSKELKIKDQFQLLGYRTDIPELNRSADLFAFPSKREGLGLAAIEAMASGLPLITSNIHGIKDYSIYGRTGFSCNPNSINEFADFITYLYKNKEQTDFSTFNILLSKKYDKSVVNKKMNDIYSRRKVLEKYGY